MITLKVLNFKLLIPYIYSINIEYYSIKLHEMISMSLIETQTRFFLYLLLNSVVHRSSLSQVHPDNHVTKLIREI